MVKKTKTSAGEQALSKEEALKVADEPGMDFEAILESKVAAAVNKVLTDSHLSEIVPAMRAKMDATDKELSELKQILVALGEKAQAGVALAQASGGQGGISDFASLVALLKGGGDSGGLAGMAQMANALGTVMKSVLEPVMGIYAMGQKSTFDQISILARTGAPLPWEKHEETK